MSMSKYLRHLRERIGHDLVLMPAVAAIIFDGRGRILLIKCAVGEGWGTPGGSVEPDEQPADAVVRETWEETGLLIEPERVLGVYGGPEFRVTYANRDQVSYLGTAFECRVVGGALRPDLDKVSEVAYFSQAELTGLDLSPLQRVILADVFAGHADDRTRFQSPTWQPPAGGVRKGGMSDYLHSLRQKVGHDLLFMPAVGGIIRDDRGRVLLQKRTDTGRWHPPGGAIEPHEHPADAVVREVWEETGLLVEPVRVTGVYGGSDFYVTYPNGDQIVVYSVMFECRVVGGEMSPDGIEALLTRRGGIWVELLRPEERTDKESLVRVELFGEEFRLMPISTAKHTLADRELFFGVSDTEQGWFDRPMLWWGEVSGPLRSIDGGTASSATDSTAANTAAGSYPARGTPVIVAAGDPL